MSLSSVLFCDTCGAANRPQAQFCRVCGQSLRPVNGSFSTTITGLLAPQILLKERYTIYGQAGRGGFGAVYKAADTQFGDRLVAIKEMSQSTLEPQELTEAVESFKREALLLAGLLHPNLPRIYEQFIANGRSYLVMDYIEGETLEERLQRLGTQRLPLSQIFDIGLQLCSVLAYLHTRQPPIIFRDLKPANIMLTPSEHVFLIDFGIARHFKPGQQKDTTALGSSGYAPPEQYGKSQTTLRADIYSLGATLHQLLTGNDPSETPFHFAPLHLTDLALAGLEKLIMSMVNITITQRPENITFVQQELQRIATQYTIQHNAASPGSLASTLPPLPVRKLPADYQPPAMPQAARKRVTKAAGPAQIYPQANTLYICFGHSSRITAVAWSPNGAFLASASYDKTVQIWDGTNGHHTLTYTGHSARVNALTWSPDGKFIASASDDRTVKIWKTDTGETTFTYQGHHGPVNAVAWSPDGAYLCSAGDDKVVQLWHATTHALFASYTDHTDKILVVAWSPNGRYLASAGKDCAVKIKEPFQKQQKRSFLSTLLFPQPTPKTLHGFENQINALAWSPDSKQIATANSNHHVLIKDVLTGANTQVVSTKDATIKNTVAWSPNGKHLTIGGNDKLVRIWNTVTRKEAFTYYGHASYVTTATWSPDSSRVASAGVDRTIQVWQAV